MAIVSKFIFEEDRESGIIGFRPLAIKGGESTTSVAHDILEHFPSPTIPGVEGELMALGAMLALRIESGLTSPYLKCEETLAALMLSVVEWALDNQRKIKPLPSRALSSDYEWAEGIIKASASRLHDLLVSESTYRLESYEIPPKGELAAAVIPWLRKGYRGALRRYAGLDLYTLGSCLFNKLEKFSQRLAASGYLAEGTQVTFCVSPRSGHITASAYGEVLDF